MRKKLSCITLATILTIPTVLTACDSASPVNPSQSEPVKANRENPSSQTESRTDPGNDDKVSWSETEQKSPEQSKLATPTPTPTPAGIGAANWRGGDWTNRDDILPYKNEEGYIVFGAYEQDGDESNGPEPIEWEVLEENGNGIFLVSRYVLDAQPYNTKQTDVTWESCTLRSWLNGKFMNKAFTPLEQVLIQNTNIANPDNPINGILGGNDTKDKIFLLSVDEIISYTEFNSWHEELQYGYSMDQIITATEYAKQQGTYCYVIMDYDYSDDYGENLVLENYSPDCIGREGVSWWLRSSGGKTIGARGVNYFGNVGWYCSYGLNVDSGGVRPALYIKQ